MSSILKHIPLLLIALGLIWLGWMFLPRKPLGDSPGLSRARVVRKYSFGGEAPNWKRLEVFQDSITRAEFESLLTTVFTIGNGWETFLEIDDGGVLIRTSDAKDAPVYHLRFAVGSAESSTPRYWKTAMELGPGPEGRPLDGLRIAIDPGHIGGEWGRMEERWFKLGEAPPVCEGDMTLYVARLLDIRLTALGAKVCLVRKNNEPLTRLRPDTLMEEARQSLPEGSAPEEISKVAERLFYRTSEIRARAKLVNDVIKPDLVLCLHFNADPWGDASQPILVERSHFHLLLNGAFTDAELQMEDQRCAMVVKLLSRAYDEELRVATTVAEVFSKSSGLPAFSYPEGSANARSIDGNPYLWARNLLANRLYRCPVIFMEPYVMNSKADYLRIQAGDYPGLREVGGKLQRSIFKEYADCLTEALVVHYRKHRKPAP